MGEEAVEGAVEEAAVAWAWVWVWVVGSVQLGAF